MNTTDKNTNKSENFVRDTFTDKKVWREVLAMTVANAIGVGLLLLITWGAQRCSKECDEYNRIDRIERTHAKQHTR